VNASFNPLDSRRTAIRDYWNEEFGWQGLRLSGLSPGELSGGTPIGLYNSVLGETGERLAFTNISPVFFRGFDAIGMRPLANPSDRTKTDLAFAGISGLAIPYRRLTPDWDPELALVVHMSSCFPFGFARTPFGASGARFTAMDGGGLDNTGVDSTLSLLRGLRDPQQGRATEAANRTNSSKLSVGERGVLILSMNSSELAIDRTNISRGLDNLSGTSQALWRGSRIRDGALISGYIDQIPGSGEKQVLFSTTDNNGILRDKEKLRPDKGESQKKYRDLVRQNSLGTDDQGNVLTYTHGYESGEKSPDQWAFFQVRPGESNDGHVATSWHLPEGERRTLYKGAFSWQVTKGLRHASLSFLRMFMMPRPRGGPQ
jgi:hypothetical protein